MGRILNQIHCVMSSGGSLPENNKHIVLSLSLSSILKLNELQRGQPKSLFNYVLHYSDACTEPQLTLSICSGSF